MRNLLFHLLDKGLSEHAAVLLQHGADFRASWVQAAKTDGKAFLRLLELKADPDIVLDNGVSHTA